MDTENLLILIKLLRDELKKKDKIIKILQKELNDAQIKLKKTKNIVKQNNNQVNRLIFNHNLHEGNFFKLQTRQRFRYEKKIKLFFNSVADTLKRANLMITKITINRYDTKINDFSISIKQDSTSNDIYKHLYYKDKFYVSDETYRQLRNTLELDCVFQSHQIVIYRQNVNLLFEMMIVDLENKCLMFNFKIIMQIRITRYLQSITDKPDKMETNKIKIKISSDGTQVGRKQSFINITCTFPGEKEIAKSINGNYTLGICQFKECYDNYSKPFKYLNEEIGKLSSFVYGNSEYQIDYSFVGDLPVLRSVLGLTGFNSSYPCFSCKVHKKNLFDFKDDFSIFSSKFKRSYDEQEMILKEIMLDTKRKDNLGYKNKPLLTSIECSNFCFDTLNLELNISRSLISLFERELMSLDNITQTSNIDLNKHLRIGKYFRFLNNKCNLNLEPSISSKNGQTKLYRSLRAFEYNKIFKRLNIIKDFSDIRDAKMVHRLWNDFQLILSNIKRNSCSYQKMKISTRKWSTMFSKHYNAIDSKSVYFHILVHHTHEYMKIHGNIHNLNLQGILLFKVYYYSKIFKFF